MKKNVLFDCGLLQKKTKSEAGKRKPIPLGKYLILCEKEMIVDFLVNIAPFASMPRRINNSANRGEYESFAKFHDFLDITLVNGRTSGFIECGFAKCFYVYCYGGNYDSSNVKLTFEIHNSFKKEVIDDYRLNIDEQE